MQRRRRRHLLSRPFNINSNRSFNYVVHEKAQARSRDRMANIR